MAFEGDFGGGGGGEGGSGSGGGGVPSGGGGWEGGDAYSTGWSEGDTGYGEEGGTDVANTPAAADSGTGDESDLQPGSSSPASDSTADDQEDLLRQVNDAYKEYKNETDPQQKALLEANMLELIRQFVLNDYAAKGVKPSAEDIANDMNIALGLAAGKSPFDAGMDTLVISMNAGLAVGVSQSDDSPRQNVHADGDPVEMFAGQFVQQAEDVRVKGAGIDFAFVRTYKNKVAYDGPLGCNWDHSYNLWIGELGQSLLIRSTGELREHVYRRHPKFGGAAFNYWVPPDGVHDIIFEDQDSFACQTPEGLLYRYEPNPEVPGFHRLRRMEDRFGRYLAFHYTDSRLTQVEVNHSARIVRLDYDERDRICAITDPAGRIWRYTYDGLGDLVAFSQPATSRYLEGLTTRYEYSTSDCAGPLAHNLQRIWDPAGRLYLENQYGQGPSPLGFNRVIRQRLGGGEIQIEYEDVEDQSDPDLDDIDRPSVQVNFSDRSGQPIHLVYNCFGNLLLREQLARTRTGFAVARWYYRYNRDGALVSILSPERRLTQCLYGRDDYLLRYGITDDEIATHEQLTAQERQAFGNLLTRVRRGRFRDVSAAGAPDAWGQRYPDVFAADARDSIQKWTYESDYQQIVTVSDPRYTSSADPHFAESAQYAATLIRQVYTGPPGRPNLRLAEVVYPNLTRPDGTQLLNVTDRFEVGDNGQLLSYTDPVGTTTRYSYFGHADGLREGFLSSVVRDPAGLAITTTYERDLLGRITAIRLPRSTDAASDEFVTRLEINELDQVTSVRSPAPFHFLTRQYYDRNGKIQRIERDAEDGQGAAIPGGPEIWTFERDDDLNVVRATVGGADPANRIVTRHAYDASGRRIVTVLPGGNKVKFRYDERGQLVAVTAGAGTPEATTRRVRYDLDGLLLATVSGRGFESRLTRDALGRTVAFEDPLGNLTRFIYDKADHLLSVRGFERAANGSYALLARTEIAYDELQRPIRWGTNLFDDPLPSLAPETDYDASPGPGRLLNWLRFLDAKGRFERSVDPQLRSQSVTFGALDLPTLLVDSDGNRQEYQYDAHGNLVRRDEREVVRDPSTGAPTGEIVFTSEWDFDQLDRLSAVRDSLGNASTFGYDSRDNLVRVTDPLGNVRRWTYDLFGRQIRLACEMTDSGVGGGAALPPAITEYGYDSNGNLVRVTDPLGRTTEQRFDSLDRLSAIVYPDSSIAQVGYDLDSLPSALIDNRGVARRMTRDGKGRVERVDVDLGAVTAGMIVEGETYTAYGYDALDRLRAAENDFARSDTRVNSVGWPVEDRTLLKVPLVPPATEQVVRRTFDDLGALASLTYPDGRSVSFTHDSLGRLRQIDNTALGSGYPGSSPNAAYLIARFEFRGRARSRCVLGNGADIVRALDAGGRLVETTHRSPAASTLLKVQQLADAAGNVRFRNDIAGATCDGGRFFYDSLYRLTSEEHRSDLPIFDPDALGPPAAVPSAFRPPKQAAIDTLIGALAQPPGPPSWAYDLAGNRLAERSDTGDVRLYVSNALDQYVSVDGVAYAYDPNGNLTAAGTRIYRYDSLNRLVRILDASGSDLARYFHDATGRRCLEIAGPSTTSFVHDRLNLIAEYRVGSPLAQMVYDHAGAPVHLAAESHEFWYHTDPGGTVRLLTGEAGQPAACYRYAPFGEGSGNPPAHNRLRYAAQLYDQETGLYHFGARVYSPKLGRFLQRDPAGMIDGTNLYGYAGNNPLSFYDPSGMDRVSTPSSGQISLPAASGIPQGSAPPSDPWASLHVNTPSWWKDQYRDLMFEANNRYNSWLTRIGAAVIATPALAFSLVEGAVDGVLNAPYRIMTAFDQAGTEAAMGYSARTTSGVFEHYSLAAGTAAIGVFEALGLASMFVRPGAAMESGRPAPPVSEAPTAAPSATAPSANAAVAPTRAAGESKFAVLQGSSDLQWHATRFSARHGQPLVEMRPGALAGVDNATVVAHGVVANEEAAAHLVRLGAYGDVTPARMAEILVNDLGWSGGTLRLGACKTGLANSGSITYGEALGQELSRRGAPTVVIAPEGVVVWHKPWGIPRVGPDINGPFEKRGKGWWYSVE